MEEFQCLSVKSKMPILISANQVVLDAYNWNRYSEEIASGCSIADQEFLSKIELRYGFTEAIDQVALDKPALFTLGRQDSVVGYQDAFSLLDRFPRATFAVLDRAGHNLQIEQAGLFEALIREWLERVEEAGF